MLSVWSGLSGRCKHLVGGTSCLVKLGDYDVLSWWLRGVSSFCTLTGCLIRHELYSNGVCVEGLLWYGYWKLIRQCSVVGSHSKCSTQFLWVLLMLLSDNIISLVYLTFPSYICIYPKVCVICHTYFMSVDRIDAFHARHNFSFIHPERVHPK